MATTDSSQHPSSSVSPGEGSRSADGSGAPRTGSSLGSTGETGSLTRHLNKSVCSFWLGQRCYAIETSLVGEVVAVESVTPVLNAHAAILGLFNLRGMPVALVDLAQVLELPAAPATNNENRVALVLRSKHGVLAAALIDRIEMVVPPGVGQWTPRMPNEHPAVQGFLAVEARGGLMLTLVDSAALMQRMERLKYRT
jgi:chemotaxis signal transduction protein